jgi:chromosome segregation ATPase
MFGLNRKEKTLSDEVTWLEREIEGLRKEKNDLKDDNARLKSEREIHDKELAAKGEREDETLKHRLKMREEAKEVEFLKKAQELERKYDAAVAAVREEYRKKTEEQLERRGSELKEMYGQILARLPDINVQLKGGVGRR